MNSCVLHCFLSALSDLKTLIPCNPPFPPAAGWLAMEFIDVTLQKPMGIVLEENDPKIKGVYVKSLSQVHAP